ncbi:MAG: ATP-binding protein [Thermodesulfobacteriota bacterium]
MRIAVASGKGGTGKTTVAVSLALAAEKGMLIDCDVEAPNSHLFLGPEITESSSLQVPVPELIEEKCNYCGLCRDICRFNAITVFGETAMIFPEMCHGCGGCFLACPEEALKRGSREIGEVEVGQAGQLSFVQGRLRIGEAMAPPLIKEAQARAKGPLVIFDAPPGTSCPMVTCVRAADFTLLVTEPTPFGHHDLKLAVAVLRQLERPFAVIINKDGLGDERVAHWCIAEGIDILMRIPFSREAAKGCAARQPITEVLPELGPEFSALLANLQGEKS